MHNKLKFTIIASLLALGLGATACSDRGPLPEEGRLYYTVVEGGRSRIEWMDKDGGHNTYVVGALGENSRLDGAGRRKYRHLVKKAEINGSSASSPSVSRNGRLMIYVCSEPNSLRLINLETNEEEGLVKTQEPLYFPCLSRDNDDYFVYLRGDSTKDRQRLFTQKIGKSPVCIMDARRLGPPSWSNFGKNVLFSYVDSAGEASLYSVDSAHPEEEAKKIVKGASQACMAPNGSSMAAIVDGQVVICDMFSKKTRTIVHDYGCSSPSWNPSGNTLAFVKDNAVYTVDLVGDNLKRISPEGKTIYDVCWARGF
ncbi:MAG: TolB family protein [Candidatus Bruticola sp.]